MRLDWEKEVWLPWFDHWLKGESTGVMDRPAVRYYLMGDVDDPDAPGNRWVEADHFPPKSKPTRYYVHSDHTLSTEAPTAETRLAPIQIRSQRSRADRRPRSRPVARQRAL
jgi:predicted acyl esterase